MKRAAIAVVLVAAGCGAQAKDTTPRRPHLPRALAESWARQADAVAAALASNDGCTAQTQATSLQQSVITAVNDHRVPRRFLEPLSSGVNDLVGRITCTPPVPAPPEEKPKHEKEKKKHHDHGKHKGKGHD